MFNRRKYSEMLTVNKISRNNIVFYMLFLIFQGYQQRTRVNIEEGNERAKKERGTIMLWEPARGQTVGQLYSEHIYLL